MHEDAMVERGSSSGIVADGSSVQTNVEGE